MNNPKNPKLGHNKKTFLEKPVEHIDITSFDSRKIIESMDKMSFTSRDTAKASGISYLRTRSIGILELATMQVTPDQMNRVLFLIDELRELSEPVELTNLSVGQLSEKWTSIGKEFNPERILAVTFYVDRKIEVVGSTTSSE